MKIMVVGSGGREHALAWKISQSEHCGKLYCAPGNPGTAELGENLPVQAEDVEAVVAAAREKQVDMVVVGPEDPLAAGMTDAVRRAGIMCFGPTAAGARIEADKAYAKELMRSAAIPTAEARIFKEFRPARDYVLSRDQGVVVKAAGLAKGKGVFVCPEPHMAVRPLEQIMIEGVFGDAGHAVVVEELLTGQEASILALCDGRNIYTLEASQDHKPIGDGDTGPNTGGMGAYSPTPVVDEAMTCHVEREILVPVVDAMRRSFGRYEGCLYAGLMITPAGPKVLEFNCRFGDPETQPLVLRLKSDLVEAMVATCRHRLEEATLEWDPRPAVCVVMAAGGYPGSYEKGHEITGIDAAEGLGDVKVFHAGTAWRDGRLLSSGGRVLGVTALGDTIAGAQKRVYQAVEKIRWKDCYYRKDIAEKAIKA
ncbi:MAG: phosphoribosylamine--glycine ligase [Phycisphaerae bacterium SM23_33]|nr:MAG: phosphoribosylamine--glycine ligase [Phycisphaerae bacterium SM23_33]